MYLEWKGRNYFISLMLMRYRRETHVEYITGSEGSAK
jgi:hypothetical protein